METFAEKVTRRLAEMGRSQGELGAAIGTTQQQVSRWVSKNAPPGADYLLPMARYLGVSVDYLIDPEIKEPPGSAPGLTEDEQAVLRVFRALLIDGDEVIRRLYGVGAVRPLSPEMAARIEAKRAASELSGEIIRRERAARAATPRKRRNGGD